MNKYLWGLLTIALIFSLSVIGWRVNVERQNSTVETVVDYDDLVMLESISGQKINQILDQLKQVGILSIAVSEDTLQKLSEIGRATIISGEDFLNKSRIGQNYLVARLFRRATGIVAGRQYVVIDEDNLFRRTRAALFDEYGKELVTEVGDKVLEIKGNLGNFKNIGLGLDPNVTWLLTRKGFNLIPRIYPATNLTDTAIALKMDTILDLTKAKTIIFNGNEVLGVNKNLETVIAKVKDKKINVGIIEFNQQLGIKKITRSLPAEQSLSVHSIVQKQLQQLEPQRAVERFLLAVNERGVRLLYIHPYLNAQEDLLAKNMEYFQNIQAQLKNKGFRLQQIDQREFVPMPHKDLITFLVSLSVVVFAFLFLKIYFPNIFPQIQYALTALLVLTFFIFYKIGALNFYCNLTALVLSVIVPIVAMILAVPNDLFWEMHNKQKFWQIIKVVLKIFGITLLGVVFISALLSDPYYLFRARQFSGVKIAYLLPPLLVAFYYLFYPDKIKAVRFILRRFLDVSITLRQVLLWGFVTIFLMVYLMRSGNFSFPPLGWELDLRKLLTDVFVVRPRTKEFLIGYPVLMLMLYYLKVTYRFKWIVAAGASVALSSLVNTFLHIHSPFMISLWRSINGLFLGVVIGFLLILVISATKKIYQAIIF